MNIYDNLPSGFEYKNLSVKLETSTLFWLRLGNRLERQKENQADLFLLAIKSISKAGREVSIYKLKKDELEAIFAGIIWFMTGGKNTDNSAKPNKPEKKNEKTICHAKDIDAIYAAFYQVYKIDLWQFSRVNNGKNIYLIDDLHYWKFKALLDNLPEGNILKDFYMKYRAMDLSKLPSKTEPERKYKRDLQEIKDSIRLDAPQEYFEVKEMSETALQRMVIMKKNLNKVKGRDI